MIVTMGVRPVSITPLGMKRITSTKREKKRSVAGVRRVSKGDARNIMRRDEMTQERAAWLEERRKGCGGSDIAAIMGLSPWKTAYQCYLEKRGEGQGSEENDAMRWGKIAELSLRQFYSDETGRAVRLPNKIMYHKEYPYLLANLDGFTDDGRIVELKTARYPKGWGEPGTAEVPESYALQVQHYMLVSGFHVADVVVSIGGGLPSIYVVPEDLELQQMIIDACREFWARVVAGNPPEIITYVDATTRFGYGATQGAVIATDEAVLQAAELRIVQAERKALESREEDLKAKLIIAIGENGDYLVDSVGDTLVTYKLAKGRETFDSKSFAKDDPVTYLRYVKVGVPSRRFLIK